MKRRDFVKLGLATIGAGLAVMPAPPLLATVETPNPWLDVPLAYREALYSTAVKSSKIDLNDLMKRVVDIWDRLSRCEGNSALAKHLVALYRHMKSRPTRSLTEYTGSAWDHFGIRLVAGYYYCDLEIRSTETYKQMEELQKCDEETYSNLLALAVWDLERSLVPRQHLVHG